MAINDRLTQATRTSASNILDHASKMGVKPRGIELLEAGLFLTNTELAKHRAKMEGNENDARIQILKNTIVHAIGTAATDQAREVDEPVAVWRQQYDALRFRNGGLSTERRIKDRPSGILHLHIFVTTY